MAKYKNFGELNVNDYIFSAEIKNSQLLQNCVGQIYDRYIITNIDKNVEGNDVVLSIAYDRSTFLKGWTLEKGDTEKFFIKTKLDSQVKIINSTYIPENLNYKIFATNIEAISEFIEETAKNFKADLDKQEENLKRLRGKLMNLENNFSIRHMMSRNLFNTNAKPVYQETVVTESVIV